MKKLIIKSKVKAVVSGRWSVVSFAPSHPRTLAAVVSVLFFLFTVHCSLITAQAQSNEFTFQGRLLDNTLPPTANYDFEFSLWDSLVDGTQAGTTQTITGVAVANGIFTVRLNFGSQFPGAARFLQIAVRPTGPGAYTLLAPRQPFTSAPYSIKSSNATAADKLSPECNLCVTDAMISDISGSKVTGTVANATSATNATTATSATTAGNVTGVVAIANGGTGSTSQNFVDLTTNQTVGGTKTFTNAPVANGSLLTNINGSAVTGTIPVASVPAGSGSYIQNQNASAQVTSNFNISGTGTANIFSAGTQYNIGANRILSNAGTNNLFAGVGAGSVNTGFNNSFFGRDSGFSNTTGTNNSFFGLSSGGSNTTGGNNSFFGTLSGISNTAGFNNSFFGRNSGLNNTTGGGNSFFGSSSGDSNTTGADNSFFGINSGAANTTGGSNAFFGRDSGGANTTGEANSFFGTFSGDANTTGNFNSFFGSFSGRANTTGFSNSFFGRDSGAANTTGGSNAFFGTSSGGANTTGGDNSFFGTSSGDANTTGFNNSFFGKDSGGANTTGSENSFFGRNSGGTNTTGSNNTFIGESARVTGGGLNFATAIGSNAIVTASNQVQLGRDGLDTVRIGQLAAATSTQLCINAASVLAFCSSSARYKENVQPFRSGLNLVRRLNPVTYDWIERKEPDLGLIAEEVEKVEPLLVTYNHKGEIQGVKYDQITVALINAVKEQQSQIEEQQNEITRQALVNQKLQDQLKRQQSELDALKTLVCAQNPTAEICQPKD